MRFAKVQLPSWDAVFIDFVDTAHNVGNFLRKTKLICSLFRKLFVHYVRN